MDEPTAAGGLLALVRSGSAATGGRPAIRRFDDAVDAALAEVPGPAGSRSRSLLEVLDNQRTSGA